MGFLTFVWQGSITINSMEHKTTGRNSMSWREKWQIMLQVESYTHLLYSMFPIEEVGKVIIKDVFTKADINGTDVSHGSELLGSFSNKEANPNLDTLEVVQLPAFIKELLDSNPDATNSQKNAKFCGIYAKYLYYKYHFKKTAEILIAANQLKRIHIPALELMAVNLEQWEWAYEEIHRKNRRKRGTGYVQKFSSGAENISVYVSLKRDAEKAIMQCIKQFGLDPKSEKELKSSLDPAQGDLFEGFKKLKE